MTQTKTKPPPQPGHADKLKPDTEEAVDQAKERLRQSVERGEEVHSKDLQDNPEEIPSQQEMQSQGGVDVSDSGSSPSPQPKKSGSDTERANTDSRGEAHGDEDADIARDIWEPKPPKVLMDDPNATPLELCAQIQIYATTE